MPSKRQTKRKLPFIIIGTVLVLVVFAGSWLYSSRKLGGSSTRTSGTSGAQPPHILGPVDARVGLEEFGDFQCPSCGTLHPVLKKLESEYDSRVALTFREFPLAPIHPNALEAAHAAEAAGLQDRFWQMHDLLYDYQAAWSDSKDARSVFAQYAADLGLDAARLRQDMDSQIVKERIAADQRRAVSLGVTGTPTLFINGREVAPDSLTEKGLRALIEEALKHP
jgi:protein-disulfide isomerase